MTRDPRRPMRAPSIVPQRELLDQDHRLSPPRQVVCRGRAHRAGTDDHMLRINVFHDCHPPFARRVLTVERLRVPSDSV